MLILNKRLGRRSNILFQFASVIANAIEYDYKVINYNFQEFYRDHKGTERGKIPQADITVQFLNNKFLTKVCRKILFSVSDLIKILFPKNYYKNYTGENQSLQLNSKSFLKKVKKSFFLIDGWWYEDIESFVTHSSVLRKIFTPSDFVKEKLKEYFDLFSDNEYLVGVHIRWGDYRTWKNGKFNFSLETYRKYMEDLLKLNELRNRKIRFLICSDEEVHIDILKPLPCIKGPGSDIEDLYCLSQCSLILGPPSSFSAWASFYGDKPLYLIKNVNDKIRLEDFKICAYYTPDKFHFFKNSIKDNIITRKYN
ncbi:MAG: alpha-1,2-fucosyltransferase [Bacteroidales bacterium]|nr:alpha-1,2-fucosyltransferase [Bacteroidales bacterium]